MRIKHIRWGERERVERKKKSKEESDKVIAESFAGMSGRIEEKFKKAHARLVEIAYLKKSGLLPMWERV